MQLNYLKKALEKAPQSSYLQIVALRSIGNFYFEHSEYQNLEKDYIEKANDVYRQAIDVWSDSDNPEKKYITTGYSFVNWWANIEDIQDNSKYDSIKNLAKEAKMFLDKAINTKCLKKEENKDDYLKFVRISKSLEKFTASLGFANNSSNEEQSGL